MRVLNVLLFVMAALVCLSGVGKYFVPLERMQRLCIYIVAGIVMTLFNCLVCKMCETTVLIPFLCSSPQRSRLNPRMLLSS